jgi:hypothetical protein
MKAPRVAETFVDFLRRASTAERQVPTRYQMVGSWLVTILHLKLQTVGDFAHQQRKLRHHIEIVKFRRASFCSPYHDASNR